MESVAPEAAKLGRAKLAGLGLIYYVHLTTGKPHYDEVTSLIAAAHYVKNGEKAKPRMLLPCRGAIGAPNILGRSKRHTSKEYRHSEPGYSRSSPHSRDGHFRRKNFLRRVLCFPVPVCHGHAE